jgi:hypothetical protein
MGEERWVKCETCGCKESVKRAAKTKNKTRNPETLRERRKNRGNGEKKAGIMRI